MPGTPPGSPSRPRRPGDTLLRIASFFYADPDAPRPNRPRKVAVTALIENERRLLFERRADAPLWGLIAGGVLDDETLEDALRREVNEETGLQISNYDFFGTFSDPSRVARYPDGNIMRLLTLAYRVNVADTSEMRTSPESVELRFFARDDLPTDELVATHRPIIARYLSNDTPPFLE
jgi:8-oxo-dGTP pyrophosphatase MutT (NUDIX family)